MSDFSDFCRTGRRGAMTPICAIQLRYLSDDSDDFRRCTIDYIWKIEQLILIFGFQNIFRSINERPPSRTRWLLGCHSSGNRYVVSSCSLPIWVGVRTYIRNAKNGKRCVWHKKWLPYLLIGYRRRTTCAPTTKVGEWQRPMGDPKYAIKKTGNEVS